MVQISIENTPHLFTVRLTTFEALVQAIARRVGNNQILPLSYFDRNINEYVPLENEDIEPLRRKTHVKIRLGTSYVSAYEGELNEQGKKYGHGIYRWPNGRIYVGEWYEDQMDGEGIETWPNGSRYQGQFRANRRHGHGCFTWPDGRQYVGEYRNDYRHGYGICKFPNGYCYEGEWFEGKKHGRGMEMFPDGHRYNGLFQNDKVLAPTS